jgi:hypothetical protein
MAISGQKTVTTAGEAVALGSGRIDGALLVKALASNTGMLAVGNDGSNDVSLSNGLPLEAGEAVVFEWVGELGSLYLDAAVDGEGAAWIRLNA